MDYCISCYFYFHRFGLNSFNSISVVIDIQITTIPGFDWFNTDSRFSVSQFSISRKSYPVRFAYFEFSRGWYFLRAVVTFYCYCTASSCVWLCVILITALAYRLCILLLFDIKCLYFYFVCSVSCSFYFFSIFVCTMWRWISFFYYS